MTWKDVYSQLDAKDHEWIKEISEVVQAIRDNGPIRQVLHSFVSVSGRVCLPLVSRVEHVKREPRLISVIFVETETKQKDSTDIEYLTRVPAVMSTIVSLLNLARRFRWNILEYYIAKLEFADLDTEQLNELLADMYESLTRLEQEAEHEGLLQMDSIVMALPDVPRETIRSFFEGFYQERSILKEAINETNRNEVVASLGRLRSINKKFLLIGLAEYTKKIASLQPTEIKTVEDALQ